MALEANTGKHIKVDIEASKWDRATYWGRTNYFFSITNPRNVFTSPSQLDRARDIVTRYKKGESTEELAVAELWQAKRLYDSAFHSETGEKMLWAGRMSAQVPMYTVITGCLLTFYKSTGQVIFWQWFNQSANLVVSYTNRSRDSPTEISTLGTSYVCATIGALVTALGLNSLVKHSPSRVGRFVPFCAVAAANCIKVPLTKHLELENEYILGTPLITEDGKKAKVTSKKVATQSTYMVTGSRIGMVAPAMLLTPIFMDKLDKRGILARYPRISLPLQMAMCGVFLTMMTPLCCALCPQKIPVQVGTLENEARVLARWRGYTDADYLYYKPGFL